MAKLAIRREHGVSLEEAASRSKVCLQTLIKEHPQVAAKVTWSSDGLSADVKGRGFSGQLQVDGSTVDIKISLSLLVSAFKGKVENTLNNTLDDLFPG